MFAIAENHKKYIFATGNVLSFLTRVDVKWLSLSFPWLLPIKGKAGRICWFAEVSVGRPRRPTSDRPRDLWSGVFLTKFQAEGKPPENVTAKKLLRVDFCKCRPGREI